ncbi:ribosome small subunit-dependent GTPase A, partial [Miniimonas arenae]
DPAERAASPEPGPDLPDGVDPAERAASPASGPAAPARRTVALRPGGVLGAVVGEPQAPAVGDRVVEAPTATDAERVLLAPRTSELVRDSADRSASFQVLAANVDVVLVVEHLDPEPKIGRLERLGTLAWNAGATPLAVLTKADLVTDATDWVADVEAALPGVTVLPVSATTGEGVDALRDLLEPGTTVVVVGPSGAGKSTLVNALAGAEVMATGERRGDGKGRHTTTHRELVPLPLPRGAAWLVDTPGLRTIGLVASEDSVASTFSDVAAIAERCRFGDCAHDGEPGCAVQAALADGSLPQRRYDSWQTQLREARYAARRNDARLAAQESAQWRRRTMQMREYLKVSGKGRH